MFNLEDELKIKLPDERVELKTVGDVASVVNKIIAEQKSSISIGSIWLGAS